MRRGQPGLLVAPRADAAVLELRGRRLAEVVAEGAEHHGELPRPILGEIVDERRRLVHDLQGVRPHVALGVPGGVLRRRLERQQLRRDDRQHPPGLQEREAEGRPPRLQQELLDLAEDPLGGQLGEGHRGAQGGGCLVDFELVPGGELDGAQRAQRVLAERPGVHRAQEAGLEVAPAAPGVEELARGRVEEHRVDREVAAARGLLDRERGVALDRDSPVTRADLRVAPRQGHVDRSLDAFDPGELVHAEGLTHGVDPAVRTQQRLQSGRRQAEHLDVEVLGLEAEQEVAHGPADDVRGPARRAQRREQPHQAGGQVEVHGSGRD